MASREGVLVQGNEKERPDDASAWTARSLEAQFDARQALAVIGQVEMSPRKREVVRLTALEHTADEIGAWMNLPANTVATRLHRARAACEKALGGHGLFTKPLVCHSIPQRYPHSSLAPHSVASGILMHNWLDCYTKGFLQDMLGPTGKVDTQHEIRATDSQWADAWYEPDPAQAHLRERMGWLGKMCEVDCAFEPFGHCPGDDEVRACLRKLLTKQHQRLRAAMKKKAPAPPLPRQWTIAPSLPARTAAAFGLNRSKGWPKGISLAPGGYGLGWVSLCDLPRTRQTLLLRLMGGSGPVFQKALEDLEKLPGDAWEKQHAKEILVARRAELGQDPSKLDEGQQEFWMSTLALVQQWKAELRREGLREGQEKGRRKGHREGRKEARQALACSLRTGLLETYRVRFGSVPPAITDAVQLAGDPDKLAGWVPLFSTRSKGEIARALRVAGNGSP